MEALRERHKQLELQSKQAQIEKDEEVKKANDEVLKIIAKNKETRIVRSKQSGKLPEMGEDSF